MNKTYCSECHQDFLTFKNCYNHNCSGGGSIKVNKPSIKNAINYAIDLIYALNSQLPEPHKNPFEVIDNLECENTLLTFRDTDE